MLKHCKKLSLNLKAKKIPIEVIFQARKDKIYLKAPNLLENSYNYQDLKFKKLLSILI